LLIKQSSELAGHRLRWEELSTFIGLTDRIRDRVLITNSTRVPNEVLEQRKGFRWVGGNTLDKFHPKQIKKLRKRLGITLEDTKGLLTEKQFMKTSGMSHIRQHIRSGLLKPVGYGITSAFGVRPFYDPKQFTKLRKALGITLVSTDGLLNEKKFMQASGLYNLRAYLKRGLIVPKGIGVKGGKAGLGNFFHPKQIDELKEKLGITLDNIDGLLTEKQIRSYPASAMWPGTD